jgi:hypothetical protein
MRLPEELETMRHCSLSYVQRWSFLIMEQCCVPLAVDVIPGKHCAQTSHLGNEARGVYLGSRIPSWNGNTLAYDIPSSRPLSGQPISSKNK